MACRYRAELVLAERSILRRSDGFHGAYLATILQPVELVLFKDLGPSGAQVLSQTGQG